MERSADGGGSRDGKEAGREAYDDGDGRGGGGMADGLGGRRSKAVFDVYDAFRDRSGIRRGSHRCGQ